VLDVLPDPFFAVDRDFRILRVNRAAETVAGRSRSELLGRGLGVLLPPFDGSEAQAAMRRALAGGERQRAEAYCPAAGLPLDLDIDPMPWGLAVTFRDIGLRRQMQARLTERDELLALAENCAGIGVWEIDVVTDTVRGTPQFFAIMGLEPTADSVPMEQLRALRLPDDRERLWQSYQRTLAGGDAQEMEYRIRRPDGAVRWIFGRGRLVRDAAGQPVRLSGVDVDVTARKLSEAALRESEDRFRRVFEQSPLGMATLGRDFRLHEVNPALCRMLGYTAEELEGRPLLDIVHPDDRPACQAYGEAMLAGRGTTLQVEERFVRKSGEAFWISVHVGAIRGQDGSVLYTLGIVEDIDERRRIRQALLDSEQRLRELNEDLERQVDRRARQLASSRAQLQAFFDNSPDWLTLQRALPDGRIEYTDLNPTCEAAYGKTREEVVGRTVEEVLGVEAAQIPLHHLRECLRTGQTQRYVARRTMAGRTRTIDVLFVLVPTQGENGERYIITTARDLTDREQLEAQLRQAQKMEAIGQLTGGVAHDFNNLLAVIMGSAELAKRRPANSGSLIDNILRAGERGVALTRQLLSFSRRQPAERQAIDLQVEVPRIVGMLRTSLRGDIALTATVADDVWPVEADLHELEIALLNVAVNARDAMPTGGSFSIAIRNARPDTADAGCVAIALRDTGSGIPADVLGKVFDPFFTTKEPGAGTGLGLSQVYGFAQQSGGRVSIDSRPGAGTTVTLFLPRCDRPPAQDGMPAPIRFGHAQGRRILLVEDNEEVSRVTQQMLRSMGFAVEAVARAQTALALLDRTRFDLLLTDVVMPDGMNGLELARVARARCPGLPVLLSSGYNDVVPQAAEFRLLRKPVPYAELRDAILASFPAAQESVAPASAG
jgi:PAS domain S-box-containing protein